MIGVLIIARLGSSRLKRKHLVESEGKSFLEWLVIRIQNEFQQEISNDKIKVFITTSDEQINRDFESYAKKLDITVFYGNKSNIPLRLLDCAQQNELRGIISIDGDDILSSTDAMRNIYNLLNNNAFLKTSGLPLGMNISGFSTSFLKRALDQNNTEKSLETGWGHIFENYDSIIYEYKHEEQNIETIRATLDYEEDALFFKNIFEKFKDEIFKLKDIDLIEYIYKNEVYKINSHLNDEYWSNFNNEKSNNGLL
jgi:spore coat polysaccharide biosynthesis protein SpsF